MGYFSNDVEGMDYEARYCSRCVHKHGRSGRVCAVWDAHMIHNYDECNNKDSILHLLIPRDANGNNSQCAMFVQRGGGTGATRKEKAA